MPIFGSPRQSTRLVVLAISLFVSACTGPGLHFVEADSQSTPVPPDKVRLVILRGSYLTGAITDIAVTVDHVHVCNLENGSYFWVDVPRRLVRVKVRFDTSIEIGSYNRPFENSFDLEKVRGGNRFYALAEPSIGDMTFQTIVTGRTSMILAPKIRGGVEGSASYIVPATPEDVSERLPRLRMSKCQESRFAEDAKLAQQRRRE